MEPIRVLHVLGGLNRGGAETMVMNLYREIDRTQIQFDFIIHTDKHQEYYDDIIGLGGRIYTMPKFDGKNIFKLKSIWNKFFKDHPEYKILHSHVRSYASLFFPIAKKYGVKTIIHSHSTNEGKGISRIIKRIMEYPLRHQADYLMACSREAGKWLYGEKACRKNNYIFLPNAIDTDKYCFSKETAETYRKIFGLHGKFVLGHVGRFHEAKNHMFLLNIFAKVLEKRSDAMLLLVGDGELRSEIEYKIQELGIENQVVLTGSREDVPQLLQAMDIFVFPSRWEGLPVTVVEAQAAGLPCLISDKITTDVDLSALVNRLPIDDSNIWAEVILNSDTKRMDVIPEIKKAGFDVKDTAKFLSDLYISLGENNAQIHNET